LWLLSVELRLPLANSATLPEGRKEEKKRQTFMYNAIGRLAGG